MEENKPTADISLMDGVIRAIAKRNGTSKNKKESKYP
jgi:hypothetical protein